MVAIGREILRPGDITWGRIVSVYAVAGGLALDCVYQGKPDYLNAIVEAMTDLLEEDAAEWIATNGGWVKKKINGSYSCYSYMIFCFRPAYHFNAVYRNKKFQFIHTC